MKSVNQAICQTTSQTTSQTSSKVNTAHQGNQPHQANQSKQGLIEMTIAMVICGTIGVTVVLSGQTEGTLIFFRCLFGALILGVICLYQGLFTQTQFGKTFWVASMIGGLALLANWYFLFSAYHKTSIGIATTVYNVQPFIMVLLCAVLFHEQVTKRILGWLLVSFIGLCFISSTKISSGGAASYHEYMIGIGQALMAACLYAVASIAAKYLKGYSPVLIAFFQLALGIAVFLPFADFAVFAKLMQDWQTHWQPAGATVTLGVVHTGIMYVFLYGAIQKLEAYKVASLSFLYPVLALLIDFVFLDVRLAMLQVLGVVLIFAGAAGVNLRK